MLAVALFVAAGAPNAAWALFDAPNGDEGQQSAPEHRQLSSLSLWPPMLRRATTSAPPWRSTDTVAIGAPGAGAGGAAYVSGAQSAGGQADGL